MIKKDVRKEILKQWLDKKSIREISRCLVIHRNTVKKAIGEFREIIDEKDIKVVKQNEAYIDDIVGDKRFDTTGRWPSKVNEEVKNRVAELMRDLQWKKGSKGENAKNITTIYLELRSDPKFIDTILGYTTVCKIVNEINKEYIDEDDDWLTW